jgi:hypothetical protein
MLPLLHKESAVSHAGQEGARGARELITSRITTTFAGPVFQILDGVAGEGSPIVTKSTAEIKKTFVAKLDDVGVIVSLGNESQILPSHFPLFSHLCDGSDYGIAPCINTRVR